MSARCTESHFPIRTGNLGLQQTRVQQFNRLELADGAGRYMIDTNALARLPNLCTKVTARHKRSLNRLTLLVKGHYWIGQAPAHAFQSTIALPKACRKVKRGLSLAEMGTHLETTIAEQRTIDSFPCGRARTQPEVEREGCLSGSPHVPMNDGGLACRHGDVTGHEVLMQAHVEQTDERQSLQLPGAQWATKMIPTCAQAIRAPQESVCLAMTSNLQQDMLRLQQVL